MPDINLILLSLHNLLRWALIIAALIAIVRAYSGWRKKKPFYSTEDRPGMFFTVLFDVQLLLGFLLYFTRGWIGTLSATLPSEMQNLNMRFFAVEHFLIMLAAAVVAHFARSSAKKAPTDVLKYRRLAIWFTVALVVLLAAVPWPFLTYGRPLLRLLGIQF